MYNVPKEEESKYRPLNKEFYEVDKADYMHFMNRFKKGSTEVHLIGNIEQGGEFYTVGKNDGKVYLCWDSDTGRNYLFDIPPEDMLEPNKPYVVVQDIETLKKLQDYIRRTKQED